MTKKMLIDAANEEEVRVCVLENGKVEEFDFESSTKKPLRGNIYLARVTRVEPSLQAAFVEYGGNRHGFLAFNEIHPDYYQIPVSDREAIQAAEAEEAELAAKLNISQDDEDEPQGGARDDFDDANGETASADSEGDDSDDKNDGGKDAKETASDADASNEASSEEDDANNDDASAQPLAVEEAPSLASEPVEDAADAEDEDVAARAENEDANDDETDEDETDGGETNGDAGLIEEIDETSTPVDVQADDSDDEDGDENDDAEARADDDSEDGGEADSDDEEELDGVSRAALLEQYREARRRRQKLLRNYKIQEVIKRRQILLIQVVKEERGNKGAALTTYLSLAGRYCVLMPNTARGGGISRKIPNASDRKRLRKVVDGLEVPAGMGLIIRTAGAKRTKAEIKRDYDYLSRLWESIRSMTLESIAPSLIYEEASLIKRAIRDLYDKDIDQVLVDGEAGYREAKDFMKMLMPSHAKNVQPYKDKTPLFLRHDVDGQLDAMYQPVVKLKSGGYLVINQTEALVAVDVNSGKATRERNIEQTALKTNIEAARELARQCRLRDLAGLIVVDFIDMEEHRNNRAVEKKFKDALKTDRARIQVGRISGFGLLEMSRQRRRSGIVDGTTVACPTCAGAGVVRSSEMAGLRILRAIESDAINGRAAILKVSAALDVVLYILNQKRDWLRRIEETYGVSVALAVDADKAGDHYDIERLGKRTAPATQTAAVQPDLAEAAPVDEDDAEDEEEPRRRRAKSADSEAEDEESQDGGQKKRRRRRRKRRGSGDGDADAQSADADAENDGKAADSDGETARAGQEDDEDKPRKRRRRGRRGGRRNQRRNEETAAENGEAGNEGASQADSGVSEQAADDAGDAPIAADSTSGDASNGAAHDSANDSANDGLGDQPSHPESVFDTVRAPTPEPTKAPTREPKRELKREPAPAPTAEPTPEAAFEPASAEEAEKPAKASRKGWWQRALGG